MNRVAETSSSACFTTINYLGGGGKEGGAMADMVVMIGSHTGLIAVTMVGGGSLLTVYYLQFKLNLM